MDVYYRGGNVQKPGKDKVSPAPGALRRVPSFLHFVIPMATLVCGCQIYYFHSIKYQAPSIVPKSVSMDYPEVSGTTTQPKMLTTLDKGSITTKDGWHEGSSSAGNGKQSYSDTVKKAKEMQKGNEKIDKQNEIIVDGKKSESKIVDSFSTTVKFSVGTGEFGATSAVLVDEQKEFVLKKCTSYEQYKVMERELCVLGLLKKISWAPKVMWHNGSEMITTYMGEPMTVFNIPLDYREQYEKIITDLESVDITHGDIYKECHRMSKQHLCRKRNKMGRGLFQENYELMTRQELKGKTTLSLVDFGWSQVHGSWACNNQTINKAPKVYKHKKDRSVFDKLDLTFQRHLQVEQHFMVDWTQYYTEEKIRYVIKSWPNLLIKKMLQHHKITDNEKRIKTFSKFYNMHVDDFRGTTPFNMYFIYDLQPKYDWRPSSKGKRLVNVAMFDLKKQLRNDMPGGFKIHATDNIQETKENHIALEQPEEYQQRKFDLLSRVFEVLNFSGIDYVVLRNFEKMPDKVKIDPHHLDVDLLVSDYYEAKRLLDGDCPPSTWSTSYENGHYRVVNKVLIDGKQVDFDLRHVGDSYLDKQWQLDILKRRVKLSVGIYVPSKEDHLYSIIYHAIVQKPKISETYVKVMTSLGNFTDAQARDKKFLRDKLARFMEKYSYQMVKPHDKTVGYITK